MREGDHLKDPHAYGRFFEKWDGEAWTLSTCSGYGQTVGSCECGNEPLDSIKCGEYPD